ncbi:ATP-binding protein [Streptomyces werraensis]|uniref:ATP-binding protein n=1 Tax=Streptomyces werraensis TaxID=68284 RepID=UPI00342B6505
MRTDQHQLQDALVARTTFPCRPDAVSPARCWAQQVYCQAGGTEPETCALLVSELATNAVQHAGGERFEITVWSSLAVDVADGSPEKPVPRVASDDQEDGRGLLLVTALAEYFEVIPTEDGKISRFRLPEALS